MDIKVEMIRNYLFTITTYLIGLALLAGLGPAQVQAEQVTTPAEQQVHQELQWTIPAFWSIENLEITDAFSPDESNQTWKARFKADIKTTEPTFYPEKRTLGSTTVLRPIYNPGEVRQLRGRIMAEGGPAPAKMR